MARLSHSKRTFASASRRQSVISDNSYNDTPRPTPPPARPTRAVRAISIASEISHQPDTSQTNPKAPNLLVPTHYFLTPTAPSPFTGTLDTSLDAIMDWGSKYAGTQSIVDTLLQEVDTSTNWPELLRQFWLHSDTPTGRARYLVEELLFLVTRTLLPEQIAENRLSMACLYDRKKQLGMRLVLRYDMLRPWKMQQGTHHRDTAVTVLSLPPSGVRPPSPVPSRNYPHRRPRLANIIPTLIAAPEGGFTTHGVRQRMQHHITDLDGYLFLSDEEVAGWGDLVLVGMVSQILLHWQWLRQNNEMLGEMEVYGWEELDGKMEENDWIADDVKRTGAAGGGKKDLKGLGAEGE